MYTQVFIPMIHALLFNSYALSYALSIMFKAIGYTCQMLYERLLKGPVCDPLSANVCLIDSLSLSRRSPSYPNAKPGPGRLGLASEGTV